MKTFYKVFKDFMAAKSQLQITSKRGDNGH